MGAILNSVSLHVCRQARATRGMITRTKVDEGSSRDDLSYWNTVQAVVVVETCGRGEVRDRHFEKMAIFEEINQLDAKQVRIYTVSFTVLREQDPGSGYRKHDVYALGLSASP